MSTFEHSTKSMHVRVVIINPLHESLPKLALYTIFTYNKFIASWVRDHWVQLKMNIIEKISILPGHASDDDARRRKSMLKDYRG